MCSWEFYIFATRPCKLHFFSEMKNQCCDWCRRELVPAHYLLLWPRMSAKSTFFVYFQSSIHTSAILLKTYQKVTRNEIVGVIRSRGLRWAGHVARMEDVRSALKIWPGTPTGMRPLGRSRRRWKNNIRMDLKEIGVNPRNWIELRIGIIGEPLWMRHSTSVIHKPWS